MYYAPGWVIGTAGFLGSLEFGFVWNVPNPGAYTDDFITAGASLLIPSAAQSGGIMNMGFLKAWGVGWAGSVFYSPGPDGFTANPDGAYGWALGGAIGGSSLTWMPGQSAGGVGYSTAFTEYEIWGQIPLPAIFAPGPGGVPLPPQQPNPAAVQAYLQEHGTDLLTNVLAALSTLP